MSAILLDGKQVAAEIRLDIAEKIADHRARGRRLPGLAVILAGDDPASSVYVKHKQRDCMQVGIRSEVHRPATDVSLKDLLALIEQLNEDEATDGILVQLPLPPQIDTQRIIEAITPSKDIDGFHPYNVGHLLNRMPTLRPCTPFGVMRLLSHYGIDVRGKRAIVIGASNIVGRPMAAELLLAGATVTVCHRFTRQLARHVGDAELLISCVGKPGLIHGDWIAPGATVIDIGITRLPDGRLTGDVDFAKAKLRAAHITPVPGGVGPMTRAMLLQNTFASYAERQKTRACRQVVS